MERVRHDVGGGWEAERPIGDRLSELARDLNLLFRQELALAKAEVVVQLTEAGKGAGMVAAAAIVAFAGLLYVMAAAMTALALVLPLWASALIVGGVVLAMAGVLAAVGAAKMRARNLVPRRTLRTMKRNAELAAEQVR
jgi:putative superfamily III holin-X